MQWLDRCEPDGRLQGPEVFSHMTKLQLLDYQQKALASREEGSWSQGTTGSLSCKGSEQVCRPRPESRCGLHLTQGIKRKVCSLDRTNMGGPDRTQME